MKNRIHVRLGGGLGLLPGAGTRDSSGTWFFDLVLPATFYPFDSTSALREGPKPEDDGDPPPSTERLP